MNVQREDDDGLCLILHATPGRWPAQKTLILIKARQFAGLERAEAEGKHLGRSKSIDDAAVVAWRAENASSIKATAEHFGISQASVKRACAKR